MFGVLWPSGAILENYAPVQAGAQFWGVGGSQKRAKKAKKNVLFLALLLYRTFFIFVMEICKNGLPNWSQNRQIWYQGVQHWHHYDQPAPRIPPGVTYGSIFTTFWSTMSIIFVTFEGIWDSILNTSFLVGFVVFLCSLVCLVCLFLCRFHSFCVSCIFPALLWSRPREARPEDHPTARSALLSKDFIWVLWLWRSAWMVLVQLLFKFFLKHLTFALCFPVLCWTRFNSPGVTFS